MCRSKIFKIKISKNTSYFLNSKVLCEAIKWSNFFEDNTEVSSLKKGFYESLIYGKFYHFILFFLQFFRMI